ncbi:hypothetical protein KOI35_20825 [Actinoplanes bogorensis]|uniref:Uncharacterized protein n=1 Tax=Paractinoplanes bogorensis TaxID=1610840 RepID=A0ABS5YR80_9ACTN|nr:hypothetical protein [Actinoplanes bogorensis]MBU2665960.1 hypothetical protein [Actinoplanes bogorensis]
MTDPDRWLTERHQEFVESVADALDLEAGLRDATLARRHEEFVAGVAGSLDLEGGLAAITSARPRETAGVVPVNELPDRLADVDLRLRLRARPTLHRLAVVLEAMASVASEQRRITATLDAVGNRIARLVADWPAVPAHFDEFSVDSLAVVVGRIRRARAAVEGQKPGPANPGLPELRESLESALDFMMSVAQPVRSRVFELVAAGLSDEEANHPDFLILRTSAVVGMKTLAEMAQQRGGAGTPTVVLGRVLAASVDLAWILSAAVEAAQSLTWRSADEPDLNEYLDRAHEAARQVAGILGVPAIGELADARPDDVQRLRRQIDDFRGADIESLDLEDVVLTGIRWSDGTRWPLGWEDRVRQSSVPVGPGEYEIRDRPAERDRTLF